MSTLEREPSLEIVLLGGSEVKGTGDDGGDPVWNFEGLVEFLRSGHHRLEIGRASCRERVSPRV